MKPVLQIDGERFDDLNGFWDEVSRQLLRGLNWGKSFTAFEDVLRGGFGTPDTGFVLRWLNSARSREKLSRIFDEIVTLIRRHGPGGPNENDGVVLELC